MNQYNTMIGRHLGYYRLLKPLGEGFLGTDYLAEDTRLERHVVLRVLSDRIHRDDAWKARVQEMVRATALLNHPHIVQIYAMEEVERAPGDAPETSSAGSPVSFITMEHVPGSSLKEALPSAGAPLDRGMAWCIALADALHYAHQQGCVHGALSPRCIVLRDGQTPKITDFGLVHIPRPQGDPLMSDSATLSAITGPVGDAETIGYLAPERLRGTDGDARSDVYSLGLIMHRLFTGHLPKSTPVSASHPREINPEIPPELDRIIRKCVHEDLTRRYQSMLEVRNDLEELGRAQRSALPAASGRGRMRPSGFLLAGVALLCFLLGGLISHTLLRPGVSAERAFLRSFQLSLDETLGRADRAAISYDGRMIAYTHRGRLWLRDMARVEPVELTGSTGAGQPFWSPDHAFIGHIRQENPPVLTRLDVKTGASFALCSLPSSQVYGAVWRADGRIVLGLADSAGQPGLYAVPDQSGPLTPLVLPDSAKGERAIAYPALLPDGHTLLYNILRRDGKTVELVAERGPARRTLLRNTEGQWYICAGAPTGHLVYEYGGPGRASLWAVPLDLDALTAAGKAQLIAPDGSAPSVSEDGTLVYTRRAEAAARLIWVNRGGRMLEVIDAPHRSLLDLTLAPDDRRIATCCLDNANANICLHDAGSLIPLTFDLAAERAPAFSPDGQGVVFVRQDDEGTDLFLKRTDGSQEVIRLTADAQAEDWPAFSPDGRQVLYQRREANGSYDLWYRSTETDGTPVPFLRTEADEQTPAFSPDGRHVAYASDATGRYEIYVRPFPGGSHARQVSADGGLFPQWRGEDLFYVQNNTLMTVRPGTRPASDAPSSPRTIFSGDQFATILADRRTRRYAVAKDGTRILLIQPEENARLDVMIVQHWTRQLGGAGTP